MAGSENIESVESSRNAAAKITAFTSDETKKLQTLLQAFKMALDSTGAILFVYDLERQSIFVEDNTADQWGVTTEQPGVPYETVNAGTVAEDSKGEYIRIHEEILNGASEAFGNVTLIDAYGNSGYYELHFRAILDEDGNPTGQAVGIYKNITEYTREYQSQHEMAVALSQGFTFVFRVDLDEDRLVLANVHGKLRSLVSNLLESCNYKANESFSAYAKVTVHKDDAQGLLDNLLIENLRERILRTPTYFFQYRIIDESGKVSYFECQVTEANSSNPGHSAFLAFRNIDDQKAVELRQQVALEKALEDSKTHALRAEENLALINGITGSGFWRMEYSEDGTLERYFLSDTFKAITGTGGPGNGPEAELAWSKSIHEEDKDIVLRAFREALAGADFTDEKFRVKDKDGNYIWCRSVGKVIRYRRTGAPRVFAGLFSDITHEHEEERLHSIIFSMASEYFASWVLDLEQDAIEEIIVPEYGYPVARDNNYKANAAIGVLADSYAATEQDSEKLRKFLDISTISKRLEGKKSVSAEYRSKKYGWCTATIFVVSRDILGNVVQCVLAIRCIEEAKQAEIKVKEALQDAYDAANRANTAKSDFLSRMSHDIRTPMNAIIGMTAIAAANIDDENRVKDCLGKITTSSKHLLGIINEVLDMSKIEAGKFDLNHEAFDLAELIDNLILMSRPQIEIKGHSLEVDIHDIEHEHVIGDAQRIEQVFMNLMSNAIKYTPDGGAVRLSITEKPTHTPTTGCFEFVFEDNGIGMTPEFVERLFEPFARAENELVASQQGTGLGMAITKNIVSMMNGTIDVDSAPGKGTRFTVTIFLELQERKAGLSEKVLTDLPVLVADDDKIVLDSVCQILDDLGMKPDGALDGRQALDMVIEKHEADNDYFAVILDWKMPVMDGVEAARDIRQRVGEDVPIIIISAYDWSDIEAEAREAGVNAFISKPIFKSKLSNLFEMILSKSDGEEPDEVAYDVPTMEQRNFAGKRALLVEDNVMNAEIATEFLEMANLDVDHVINGKIAVETIESCEDGYYDIVFMDIQMPVMNGYDATRAIRASERPYLKEVPIVAMTADAFADDVKASLSAGMNEHIAKPVDLDKLTAALDRWLK